MIKMKEYVKRYIGDLDSSYIKGLILKNDDYNPLSKRIKHT